MHCRRKADSEEMEKTKILMIEEDKGIRTGVRIFLNNENYHILEASNGPDGLRLLDPSVDLVILDMMMTGMSGLLI